jgi:acyl-CoA synthetase (AMP-forming)/AMP-acid ligase II
VFIVLKEGAKVTEEGVMNFLNKSVASYKAIREVEIRTQLPMTLVGKVLKRELQEEEKKRLQRHNQQLRAPFVRERFLHAEEKRVVWRGEWLGLC